METAVLGADKQRNIRLLTVLLNGVNTFSWFGFISISLSFKNKTWPLRMLIVKIASCPSCRTKLALG